MKSFVSKLLGTWLGAEGLAGILAWIACPVFLASLFSEPWDMLRGFFWFVLPDSAFGFVSGRLNLAESFISSPCVRLFCWIIVFALVASSLIVYYFRICQERGDISDMYGITSAGLLIWALCLRDDGIFGFPVDVVGAFVLKILCLFAFIGVIVSLFCLCAPVGNLFSVMVGRVKQGARTRFLLTCLVATPTKAVLVWVIAVFFTAIYPLLRFVAYVLDRVQKYE